MIQFRLLESMKKLRTVVSLFHKEPQVSSRVPLVEAEQEHHSIICGPTSDPAESIPRRSGIHKKDRRRRRGIQRRGHVFLAWTAGLEGTLRTPDAISCGSDEHISWRNEVTRWEEYPDDILGMGMNRGEGRDMYTGAGTWSERLGRSCETEPTRLRKGDNLGSRESVIDVNDHDVCGTREERFCVFQLENRLFRVHRFVLCQERCAFSDLFSLAGSQDGDSASRREGTMHAPIVLSDTVDQFRDLLWALHTFSGSSHLIPPRSVQIPLQRLINIALLCNKYCISSFEAWSIDQIHQKISSRAPVQVHLTVLSDDDNVYVGHPTAQDSASYQNPWDQIELVCNALNVAVLCGHEPLHLLIEQTLISRILSPTGSITQRDTEAIERVSLARGLRKLLGVCYYRELISLERLDHSLGQVQDQDQLIFPSNFDSEKVKRFSRAHKSLSTYWARHLQHNPTPLIPPVIAIGKDEESHLTCDNSDDSLLWRDLWNAAGLLESSIRSNSPSQPSADVLKRLDIRAAMLKALMEQRGEPEMTIEFNLAALESIGQFREEIIDGLLDRFMTG